MPCKQCKKTVSNSERILCRGPCRGEFHSICAKLDTPVLEMLGIYKNNVAWLCDGCIKILDSMEADGGASPTYAAIQSMQADIAKLTATVTTIVAGATPATPTWPSQNRSRISAKRRLQNTEDSIPTTRPRLPQSQHGKKVLQNPIAIVASPPVDDDKFYIWLGNFLPSVSEDCIRTTVKDSLNCSDDDEIVVKALVKKGVSVTCLRSITFKVGVDKKYKDASLNENNWPAGISFREFVDLDKQSEPNDPDTGFSKSARLESPMTS